MSHLYFLIILMIAFDCQAQIFETGSCNKNIKTKTPFNITAYAGRWYEYEKTPFIFEAFGKCIYAEYQLMDDGDLSVYNYQLNQLTGNANDIHGTAKVIDSGKLIVSFAGVPTLPGAGNYWVLDTDYENFAIVYSCKDIFGLLNSKVIWILTRSRYPTQETIEQARDVIKENALPVESLQKTDQTNCVKGQS